MDTDHTKCINSDSTVAREARAIPNRGHTAHHLHRKSWPFSSAVPPFPNSKGSRTKDGGRGEGKDSRPSPPTKMESGHVLGSHGLMAAWERAPWAPAESSSTSAVAWPVGSPPEAAVHQLQVESSLGGRGNCIRPICPPSFSLCLLQPTGVEGVDFLLPFPV